MYLLSIVVIHYSLQFTIQTTSCKVPTKSIPLIITTWKVGILVIEVLICAMIIDLVGYTRVAK